jgi:tetratricopeptide (TPR) repeat protein
MAMTERTALRGGLLGLGLTVVLAAWLSGCSQDSPSLSACNARADSEAKLRARLAACAAAIGEGAKGDALERSLAFRGETYRLLADNYHAMADFNQALRINTRDHMALNDRGLVYLAKDKFELARADFNAALSVNPNDVNAFNNRGIVDRYERDFDAAIRDENRAIEMAPSWASPWANRGYAYIGKRQWEMALADFGDALRLAPTFAYALEGRAAAEQGKGQSDLAIKDLTQAIVSAPANGSALVDRAEVYAERGDFDDALRDANQAVKLYPRRANMYAYRSDVYLRKRDHALALADANTAVSLSPDDASILNVRCWTEAVSGAQLDAAITDCGQSLAIRPRWIPALDSMAFIQFRQGRFAQAIAGYDAILAREPANANARFMRGVARLRGGDQGGAADVAAANAADARVAGSFASFGVRP